MDRMTLLKSSKKEMKALSHLVFLIPLAFHTSGSFVHGIICRTLFFFMLAGRFPVLMFSFIIRMLVSFWEETKTTICKKGE